ncbi:MAG TPA: hypothetical protein VK508_12170 [Cyclobacteriaceae bacterium]|nr:hypothetical protein [Cyclobacteriaceae bacterium]
MVWNSFHEGARLVSSFLFDHTNKSNSGQDVTIISNDFSSTLSMPSQVVPLSLVNGRLKATGAQTGHYVYKSISTVAGKTYSVSCDVDLASGGALTFYVLDQNLTPITPNILSKDVTSNPNILSRTLFPTTPAE